MQCLILAPTSEAVPSPSACTYKKIDHWSDSTILFLYGLFNLESPLYFPLTCTDKCTHLPNLQLPTLHGLSTASAKYKSHSIYLSRLALASGSSPPCFSLLGLHYSPRPPKTHIPSRLCSTSVHRPCPERLECPGLERAEHLMQRLVLDWALVRLADFDLRLNESTIWNRAHCSSCAQALPCRRNYQSSDHFRMRHGLHFIATSTDDGLYNKCGVCLK